MQDATAEGEGETAKRSRKWPGPGQKRRPRPEVRGGCWLTPVGPYTILSERRKWRAGQACPQQVMKRVFLFPFMVVMLSGAVFLLLLASNIHTFHRLTDEEPIAELRFTRVGQQAFEAVLRHGDFCESQTFRLYGDQWRLDAEFLKWRPWANLLGFDSMYRIQRLGSRYLDIQHENSGQRVAYELRPEVPVDLSAVIAKYHGFLTPVDTLYGSSVYAGMEEGAVYLVFRGQSGLFVRKGGGPEQGDATSGLTIEINAACAAGPGIAERLRAFAEGIFSKPDSQ